jgi:hypothetical protein
MKIGLVLWPVLKWHDAADAGQESLKPVWWYERRDAVDL